MKKTRQEKQQDKKDFRKALQQELREHKSSFIVFYTLRALAIVILIRQVFQGNYESAFYCILARVLLYLPS